MAWLMAPLVAFLVAAPSSSAAPDLDRSVNGGPSDGSHQQKVRHAAVAGSFYPADPKDLSAMIDDMLAHAAPPPVHGAILAAVAPHAGYPYSGPVAAWTYAALKGHKYSRVILIAPSHYVSFDFSSIYSGDAYETPFGTIPIDKQFAERLTKISSTIRLSENGHTPTSAGGEHSIEVELPWLQKVLGNFQLVPIVMGDQSYQNSRALGVALAKLIESEKSGETLILASSDLSHYHSYNEAGIIDRKTLHALTTWDYFSMSRNFETRIWEACGGAPIVAAMIAAERMGANKAEVLRYANSGDTSGNRSRVVGYSADLFIKAPAGKDEEPPFSLTEQEKNELLALARKSAEHAVKTGQAYDAPLPASETLNQEYGAFVTITEAGQLRGCIGYTAPIKPLYMTVRDTAAHAALRDRRFRPVSISELPQLEYEISVLSPLRHVGSIDQITIGRDGLLIWNGDHQGLLLPQVPIEQKWDRQTFLEQTCIKAGLHSGCWKDEKTDIFKFTALVFSDHKQ